MSLLFFHPFHQKEKLAMHRQIQNYVVGAVKRKTCLVKLPPELLSVCSLNNFSPQKSIPSSSLPPIAIYSCLQKLNSNVCHFGGGGGGVAERKVTFGKVFPFLHRD